jgi:hypothetical protein
MRSALVVVVVLLSSCGKKKEESASPGSAAPAGSAAAKPDDKPAGPPPKIVCEKAIPKPIIEKHFPKATTEWGDAFDNGEGSFITSCRFIEPAVNGRTIVQYRCGPTFSNLDQYLGAVESQVDVKYQRPKDIGRGGYRSKRAVGALHRTMPCVIEVEEMGDREVPDWAPLLEDLEAALEASASAS